MLCWNKYENNYFTSQDLIDYFLKQHVLSQFVLTNELSKIKLCQYEIGDTEI